jgi:hypothetical protein
VRTFGSKLILGGISVPVQFLMGSVRRLTCAKAPHSQSFTKNCYGWMSHSSFHGNDSAESCRLAAAPKFRFSSMTSMPRR